MTGGWTTCDVCGWALGTTGSWAQGRLLSHIAENHTPPAVTVERDPDCPPNTAYFLNEKYMVRDLTASPIPTFEPGPAFTELWECGICPARAYERTPHDAIEARRHHYVFSHSMQEWDSPGSVRKYDLAPQFPVTVDGEVVVWCTSEGWQHTVATALYELLGDDTIEPSFREPLGPAPTDEHGNAYSQTFGPIRISGSEPA